MRRDTGLTLIELTAAMAVFALVAVMGVQALNATLRMQDGLTERDSATWAAAEALALLRHDLGALAPMTFGRPDGTLEPALLSERAPDRVALSVAGLAVLPGTRETGAGRVEWRLDPATGALSRRYWRSLTPRDERAAGPEVVILDGVEQMSLRRLGANGWVEDSAAGKLPPTSLPEAVELRLQTERFGALRVVVAP
jgi:general secretion pathway protein J